MPGFRVEFGPVDSETGTETETRAEAVAGTGTGTLRLAALLRRSLRAGSSDAEAGRRVGLSPNP